jgi:mRNA-degrading endonuclease toxin of MazEF toxin-antitoxin module
VSILRPGRIIWAEIEDANGHKKERPAVIAEPVPSDEDGEFVVFAITTKRKEPVTPSEIPISADLEGKLGTFLKRDCVVACWWPNILKKSQIRRTSGELSAQQIRIMAHFYKNLKSKLDPGSG